MATIVGVRPALAVGKPATTGKARAMFQQRGVAITALICLTVLGLGLLTMMGWLLLNDKETTAVLTLVNTVFTAFIYSKLRDVDAKTTRVEAQTNGEKTRLMDHALGTRADGA